MDEFLRIVAMNHICNDYEFPGKTEEIMKLFEDKLKDILSEKLYDELHEDFLDMAIKLMEITFVEGMKTAIQIKDNKYVAVI